MLSSAVPSLPNSIWKFNKALWEVHLKTCVHNMIFVAKGMSSTLPNPLSVFSEGGSFIEEKSPPCPSPPCSSTALLLSHNLDTHTCDLHLIFPVIEKNSDFIRSCLKHVYRCFVSSSAPSALRFICVIKQDESVLLESLRQPHSVTEGTTCWQLFPMDSTECFFLS